jgi:hypothetical protein
VEYAASRLSELSLDPTLPTIDTSARPRRRNTAAPMPTTAFAPPPAVAESSSAAPAPSSAPAPIVAAVAPLPVPVARAPDQDCTTGCVDRWNTCRGGCKDGACDACDRSYKTCVPACFQEGRQAPRSLR